MVVGRSVRKIGNGNCVKCECVGSFYVPKCGHKCFKWLIVGKTVELELGPKWTRIEDSCMMWQGNPSWLAIDRKHEVT